ncbi:MAG: transposase [Xenococcaceae cyanobacterium]
MTLGIKGNVNRDFSVQSQLLTPFQKSLLLKHLQTDLRPQYRQRIEIMLLADRGKSQAEICAELGCSKDTARYWMSMAQNGLAHKWQEIAVGRPKKFNEDYLQRLKELVTTSPNAYGYSFQSWTAEWLSKHLENEFGIKLSARHINRLLKKMGLSKRERCLQTSQNNLDREEVKIVIRNLPSSGSSEVNNYWLWQSI